MIEISLNYTYHWNILRDSFNYGFYNLNIAHTYLRNTFMKSIINTVMPITYDEFKKKRRQYLNRQSYKKRKNVSN
jgi:hypothetical protein